MKKALMIILLFLTVLPFCSLQKEAFVFIDKKTEGRTSEGLYYLDITIKNTGEQPAYFVILIAQAYFNQKEVQRIEKAYGDIFPNGNKQQRLIFENLGINEPDSVIFKITYSPYSL